jgi:hypothetical protein
MLPQKSYTIYTLKCLKKCCTYFTRILARRRKRAAGRPDHGAAGVGEWGDGLRNGANKSIGIGKNVVVLWCAIAVGMLIAEHTPAQIPAGVIHAPGSHLGYLTAKRSLGLG